ncbi:MAG: DUF4215 domain-containing protein [Deltaproteobacteria bacterium]|nr:DUF4215 domain-containing protein [Deltaproteobacteria bacterium]
MKKNKLVVVAVSVFSFMFLPHPGYTQIFQNSDTACESVPVLCSSASTAPYTTCTSYANSISCKSKFSKTDMNNDGYTDCVLLNATDRIATSWPTFSVMLNAGSSQSACGTAPGVFNNTTDYMVVPIDMNIQERRNGSVVTGRLANTDPGDYVWFDRNYAEYPSYIGVLLPGFDLTTDEPASPLIELMSNAPADYTNGEAWPSMVLSNCGGQGLATDLYYPLVYRLNAEKLQIHALRYGAYDTNISTGIVASQHATVSIALGDFNEDGQNDVALAVNDAVSDGGLGSQLVICLSTGACSTGSIGFNCSTVQIMGAGSSHTTADDLKLMSIVTGDFNGDHHQDIAITESGFVDPTHRGVHVFQGKGNGSFVSPGIHIDGNLNGNPSAVPYALTTGCFNNDNYEDIAYSYDDGVKGAVGLILSEVNGSGDIASSTPSKLSFISGSAAAATVRGIDAADFDGLGGDDIVALATNGSSVRSAYIFMNKIELVHADAGPPASVNVGVNLPITGASCSIDPTETVSYNINWLTSSTPPGAAAPTYSSTTTLAPTVNFSSAGTYILKLRCEVSRCGNSGSNFRGTAAKIVNVSSPAVCGNGIPEPGEQCDHGALNGTPGDRCSSTCASLTCGDGIVQADLGEQCDHGVANGTQGNSCSSTCTSLKCGDGIVQRDLGEECDDGNNINGDGCDQQCRIERCGNGRIDQGEQCDDGNNISGDGCDSSCKIEVCGDHIIDAHEQCDDGNTVSGDGCSSTCQTEGTIQCGNHIIETGEGCDDGALNGTPGDPCSADCKVITANPVCGNRVIETGEACDDGNTQSGDGCSSSCTLENVANPPPVLPSGFDSQGGCAASLNPQTPLSPTNFILIISGAVILLVVRKDKQKK